jgi:[NiFe] hydrogenase assembly HybE family chaperone
VTTASDIANKVEMAFSAIRDTRMRDIPILNCALTVEVVGPRPWRNGWVLVLVTPWFMNLMMMGQEDVTWGEGDLKPGASVVQTLPGGDFSFLVSEELGLGIYLSCSLFSPMQVFQSHEEAIEVAAAALDVVMKGDASRQEHEGAVSNAVSTPEAPANPGRRKLLTRARDVVNWVGS